MQLDHLEGRVGFWLLVVVGVLMAPFFLVAEVMSWFERRR